MTTRSYKAVKDALDRSSSDPGRRILFTGGTVVTMDPAIGALAKGDVLVEGSKIIDVGADLRSQGATDNAVVVDATGSIVSPGLVDTHRHAWETQLRRTIPDVNDLDEYVVSTLAQIAPRR